MTIGSVAISATACGGDPELKQTPAEFEVFAISIASISVAVGIFAFYDDLLGVAGQVEIWLW